MLYSRIIGTGAYFPEKILTNADLMKMVDTDDKWIVERTGIHTRHISAKNEATSEMAYEAAKEALDMAGVKASEIDGIIFPTITPDYILPCAAAVLGGRLGISGPFAFDLNMACTGFICALNIADAFIKNGQCKTILIATGERLSTVTNYSDRATCILFGDAAGAAVVRADTKHGIRSCSIYADGSYGDLLYMHGMGSTYLANRDTMNLDDEMIVMKGNDVFKLAVRAMSDTAAETLEKSGLKSDDIDFVVPHQANIRIVEAVAKRLEVGMDRVIINLDRRGNCSAPTIPTALDEGIRSGKVKFGDNILMAAFGGGMNWGAAVLTL
ncbi:MAG: ketoacyl-ACP synthase III [Deferribacteraceae bacterium]|jgi:3-oxoacyl-[acyl-carrier-protein] synthase-3|nr:ketoacyl-ACP synthase III [Deferribacteraceae bacterium]